MLLALAPRKALLHRLALLKITSLTDVHYPALKQP